MFSVGKEERTPTPPQTRSPCWQIKASTGDFSLQAGAWRPAERGAAGPRSAVAISEQRQSEPLAVSEVVPATLDENEHQANLEAVTGGAAEPSANGCLPPSVSNRNCMSGREGTSIVSSVEASSTPSTMLGPSHCQGGKLPLGDNEAEAAPEVASRRLLVAQEQAKQGAVEGLEEILIGQLRAHPGGGDIEQSIVQEIEAVLRGFQLQVCDHSSNLCNDLPLKLNVAPLASPCCKLGVRQGERLPQREWAGRAMAKVSTLSEQVTLLAMAGRAWTKLFLLRWPINGKQSSGHCVSLLCRCGRAGNVFWSFPCNLQIYSSESYPEHTSRKPRIASESLCVSIMHSPCLPNVDALCPM